MNAILRQRDGACVPFEHRHQPAFERTERVLIGGTERFSCHRLERHARITMNASDKHFEMKVGRSGESRCADKPDGA